MEAGADGGIGLAHGETTLMSISAAHAAPSEVLVQEHRRLTRRGRALERLAQYGDDDMPGLDGWQQVTHAGGAVDGVELVAAFDKAGCGAEVVVCAEGDDEEVGQVLVLVRDDATGFWVDRGDGLLAEGDAGLRDARIVRAYVFAALFAEHYPELRESEDEGVALVDERDLDLVAKRGGEPRAELQASESGAADDDLWGHCYLLWSLAGPPLFASSFKPREKIDLVCAMYNDVYAMTRMIRKQVYIREDQDSRLKRASNSLGVTESELIRRGVDQVTEEALKGPRDPKAWEEAMAFMKKRGAMKVPQTGRTWTRDDLYEDD